MVLFQKSRIAFCLYLLPDPYMYRYTCTVMQCWDMKNRKIQIHPSEYFTQRTHTAAHQFHLKVVWRGRQGRDGRQVVASIHLKGISPSFHLNYICLGFVELTSVLDPDSSGSRHFLNPDLHPCFAKFGFRSRPCFL